MENNTQYHKLLKMKKGMNYIQLLKLECLYSDLLIILERMGLDKQILIEQLKSFDKKRNRLYFSWDLGYQKTSAINGDLVRKHNDDCYCISTAHYLSESCVIDIQYNESLYDCINDNLHVKVRLGIPRSLKALLLEI